MQHHYKDHTVLISTWARLEPYGYTPEYRISRGAERILHSLKLNQLFATREEAEGCGLQAAKRWIDHKILLGFMSRTSVA
jgi:hypothetical protein